MVKLLLLFGVAPVWGQFTSLSTNFDGSELFFTTALSLADGGEQPRHGKLYVLDREGVRALLIREREERPVFFPPRIGFVTEYHNLIGVDIASNGTAISVTGAKECGGISTIACGQATISDVYNAAGEWVLSAPGFVALSANGEWGLGTNVNPTIPFTAFRLYRLADGRQYDLPSTTAPNRFWRFHDFAGSQAVAIARASLPVISLVDGNLRATGPRDITTTTIAASMDGEGRMVVWEQPKQGLFDESRTALRVWRIGEAASLSLEVRGRSDWAPRMSDDGRMILFRSTPEDRSDPQVFVVGADGSGRRQLTAEAEGIANAILSGDGKVAYTVTRTGRLLRWDVGSGEKEELMGPVAAFLYAPHCLENWIVNRLAGPPGGVATARASVMPGERVEIRIGERAVRVTEVGLQQVTFELPADLRPGSYDVSIAKPGDGRWRMDSTIPLDVAVGANERNTCVGEFFSR